MFTLHEGNIDLELLHFSSVINLVDSSGFVLFRLSLLLAIEDKKQFIHSKFLVSRRLYTISPYIFLLAVTHEIIIEFKPDFYVYEEIC